MRHFLNYEKEQKTMMHSKIVAMSVLFAIALPSFADTRIVEFWECSIRDGKTEADVHAANRKWVDFMNQRVKGGGVRSYVLTNVVGQPTGFRFADSYPDMAAWSAVKALLQTPEGKSIDAGVTAVSDCTSNSLSEVTES